MVRFNLNKVLLVFCSILSPPLVILLFPSLEFSFSILVRKESSVLERNELQNLFDQYSDSDKNSNKDISVQSEPIMTILTECDSNNRNNINNIHIRGRWKIIHNVVVYENGSECYDKDSVWNEDLNNKDCNLVDCNTNTSGHHSQHKQRTLIQFIAQWVSL